MDTDADRLELIRALGGRAVIVDDRHVEGIFESEFESSQIGDAIVQNTAPQLTCRSIDIPKATTRSIVQVGRDTYEALSVEPDGTGMTVLRLQRQ